MARPLRRYSRKLGMGFRDKYGHLYRVTREGVYRRAFGRGIRRRRTNMPLFKAGERPSVGDFVLAFDEVWVIKEISARGVATIESVASGDHEQLLAINMESTSIRTWEAE